VHVVVAVRQQHVAQGVEDAGLIAAEIVRENQVQGLASLGLVFVVPVRVVPSATADYLVRGQTEKKEVFFPGLCCHFNGRAVARANRQCAVHHELHVACATGFIACRRNLVGDLAGGDQVLCE